MSKIRIYLNKEIKLANTLIIDENDFHYLKNVMRLKLNDSFYIFNENNGEFLCNIININKKSIEVKIQEQTILPKEEHINDIELIFTPIRHNRQDFLIEKTTELGIKTLSPIITQNTAIKDINTERAYLIAKEAAEQSRRISIPTINKLQSFIDKITKFDFQKKTLFYLDERQNEQNTIKILNSYKNKPIAFLIGPEGGFSKEEFEYLSKTPAKGITLGKQILRAETAGITIVSLYNIGL